MEANIQGLGLRRFLKAYQGRVISVGQGPWLPAGFAHSAALGCEFHYLYPPNPKP